MVNTAGFIPLGESVLPIFHFTEQYKMYKDVIEPPSTGVDGMGGIIGSYSVTGFWNHPDDRNSVNMLLSYTVICV